MSAEEDSDKVEEANDAPNSAERSSNIVSPPLSFPEDFSPSFKYSAEGNRRVKRAADNPNKSKSCSLYIQTDPLFWRHIRDQVKKKSPVVHGKTSSARLTK